MTYSEFLHIYKDEPWFTGYVSNTLLFEHTHHFKVKEPITASFPWHYTPEGSNYWCDVHDSSPEIEPIDAVTMVRVLKNTFPMDDYPELYI